MFDLVDAASTHFLAEVCAVTHTCS